MSKAFDVVVIGGGPGGYIAAIRAAQLGLNTACIDEWKNAKGGPAPGGTCTNVGCIPSKALLQSSEHFEHAGHAFADHGIGLSNLSIDVAKMLGRKDQVVKQNNDGILYLFKKNKVTFFHGRGSFVKAADGGYEIAVAGDKPDSLSAKHVIVATGSNRARLARRRLRRGQDPVQRRRAAHRRGAEDAGRHRRRRHRPGDGFGVAPPGRAGHGAGSAAHLPGCGRPADRQGSAQGLHQAGAEDPAGREDRAGQGGQEGRQRQLCRCRRRRADAGLRQAHRLDRPRAQHHRPERRGRRPEARRTRLRRGRRRLPQQPAQRLGGGRRGARPDAGAQGRRRRRGRGRAHCRPARACQLQHHSLGHLHQPRDRLGRPDRTAAQGRGPGLPRRQLPVPGQRPRARAGRHHRHGEDAGRRRHRRDPGRAHHRPDGQRADRRGRGGDGVQGQQRGHRAHLPCAPVA